MILKTHMYVEVSVRRREMFYVGESTLNALYCKLMRTNRFSKFSLMRISAPLQDAPGKNFIVKNYQSNSNH